MSWEILYEFWWKYVQAFERRNSNGSSSSSSNRQKQEFDWYFDTESLSDIMSIQVVNVSLNSVASIIKCHVMRSRDCHSLDHTHTLQYMVSRDSAPHRSTGSWLPHDVCPTLTSLGHSAHYDHLNDKNVLKMSIHGLGRKESDKFFPGLINSRRSTGRGGNLPCEKSPTPVRTCTHLSATTSTAQTRDETEPRHST